MLRNIITVSLLLINLALLNCQEEAILDLSSAKKEESNIYVNVDQKPEFPGAKKGLVEFYKSVSSLICDKTQNGCNTSYYQIVIDTLGVVSDFKILKGVTKELDRETENIVRQMPEWIPGEKNGKLVNVLVTLDIKYTSK